jgi:hypothetical protein
MPAVCEVVERLYAGRWKQSRSIRVADRQTSFDKGFMEALALTGVNLKRGEVLGELIDACAVGHQLAKARGYSGMSKEEIVEALGPAWVERGKDYPKALGWALIRAGFDPDESRIRAQAVAGIHMYCSPMHGVVVSGKTSCEAH